MAIRPTQQSIYSLVSRGLSRNLGNLAFAQERVATGKQILRPSDDAVGTARALSMRGRLGMLGRFQESVSTSRPILETSTAALQEISGVLTEARELLVNSMNGTMNSGDREIMGQQMALLLEQLVDVANTKFGDRYVFAGTETSKRPYSLEYKNGEGQVEYLGNDLVQRIAAGFGAEIPINVPGSRVFGSGAVQSIDLSGLTGARLGTSANEGTGFKDLKFRHDNTVGTPGSGVTFAGGGAHNTILNNHTLTIDAVAGTVQLGNGNALSIPSPSDADYNNFFVENENGAAVRLDFSGFTGVSSTAALHGEGSVSIDGTTYVPLTYTETDLELIDDESGTVLHIDTTGVHMAGDELVSFTGATDIFNVLAGAAADLGNARGLSDAKVVDRVEMRYDELLRGINETLKGLGTLGARTESLNSSESRLETTSVNLEGLLSEVEDADITSVILDLNRAEQTLQLAQATGSRLIQRTLLDFLR